MKIKRIVILFLTLLCCFGACTKEEIPDTQTSVISTDNISAEEVIEEVPEASIIKEVPNSEPSIDDEKAAVSADGGEEKKEDTTPTLSGSSIDTAPIYKGSAYTVLNGNIPNFTEEEKICTEPFEIYSNLDSLGRCGQAYANICIELMPTEERGEIGMIKPSGWHTVKYPGIVEGNYLYNRCHIIGFQLAGENANELNLITGTRYFNVESMLPFENEVANYVRKTDNHVLYRVTPIYNENNLVAEGVQIEAYSVEDQGEGICFNVFCHNIQPGIIIDYETGESRLDESAQIQATPELTAAPSNEPTQATNTNSQSADYIINTNTGKFHLPNCNSVSQMKEKNKQYCNGSYEDIINMGYEPCQNCLGK